MLRGAIYLSVNDNATGNCFAISNNYFTIAVNDELPRRKSPRGSQRIDRWVCWSIGEEYELRSWNGHWDCKANGRVAHRKRTWGTMAHKPIRLFRNICSHTRPLDASISMFRPSERKSGENASRDGVGFARAATGERNGGEKESRGE